MLTLVWGVGVQEGKPHKFNTEFMLRSSGLWCHVLLW